MVLSSPCARHIRIQHAGVILAETRCSVRTLETSHPPSYYLPPEDVAMALLRRSTRRSVCEWKGQAAYFDLVLGDTMLSDVAWSYPQPTGAFQALAGYLAFYAAPLDACEVDGERVTPQPGRFYGAGSPRMSRGLSRACRGARAGSRPMLPSRRP
jgi:uncharacterized protein (DUF427 family)